MGGQGALFANHGGGYQWRLCSVAEFTADGVKNEESFQRSPLAYATSKSAIQLSKKHHVANEAGGSRIEFDAVRVTDANTDGVMPKGSTWTRLPIPNCGGTGGGIFAKNFAPACKHGKPPVLLPYQAIDLEFPEPAEGVFGFGNSLDYETALEESDSETA